MLPSLRPETDQGCIYRQYIYVRHISSGISHHTPVQTYYLKVETTFTLPLPDFGPTPYRARFRGVDHSKLRVPQTPNEAHPKHAPWVSLIASASHSRLVYWTPDVNALSAVPRISTACEDEGGLISTSPPGSRWDTNSVRRPRPQRGSE